MHVGYIYTTYNPDQSESMEIKGARGVYTVLRTLINLKYGDRGSILTLVWDLVVEQ